MARSVYHIANMDCPTEERLIRASLEAVPGIDDLAFNLLERRLTVFHHLESDSPVIAALRSVGMAPEPPPDLRKATRRGIDPASVRLVIAGIAAASAEMVSWFTRSERSALIGGLALLALLLAGRGPLVKGLIAARNRELNINFLMTIAVLGALAIGQWPEAAMVTVLFALAERIEGASLDRARDAIRELTALAPERALIQSCCGEWRESAVADIAVGQTVRVRPGERIPMDGTVLRGESSVDQSPITGESMPVDKAPGDAVFAGTVNQNGSLEFAVTAAGGETTLARIVDAVQRAQSQRAPTQRFIDSFARIYTPGVIGVAVMVALIPATLGQPWHAGVYRALVLLVIACPCALVISTPVTVVSGLAAAARLGLVVKGGAFLEEGRRLRLIALDKTGTLTRGEPLVTDVLPLNGDSPAQLLQLAASINSHSSHPVARAISEAWDGKLFPADEFHAIPGRGARARVLGVQCYVGNHRLTEEMGLCGPDVEELLERIEREGKTAVVLSSERGALAVLGVADRLRDSSAEAVRDLRELGVETVLLSGDNQRTADAVAREAGIGDSRGDLLPEDKLAAIDAFVARHVHVGMAGDGVNDAPALARASVGFAMGAAGAGSAIETADVALMRDDLRLLPTFVRLSRATAAILAQNIALAIGIKAVFLALAMTGHATLWMAVFADMGASLLVIGNGLRMTRFGDRSASPDARMRSAESADVAATLRSGRPSDSRPEPDEGSVPLNAS